MYSIHPSPIAMIHLAPSSTFSRVAPRASLPPGLDAALWRAGQLARGSLPTASTGWPALDAELPGGGWPLAGMTELLAMPASGELSLLAPWLRGLTQRELAPRELVWISPPGLPCMTALQALGLAPAQLLCISPARLADAAWAADQALRSGSCAAVLWWSERPVELTTLRRLHLAAQSGATPLMALRAPASRASGSPAPLRLSCTPQSGRRLAIDVFKRRGPGMAAPLLLSLPWPASARRATAPAPMKAHDVVDRPAPAPAAAASPALVPTRA
jgi:protein ImuA